MKDARRTFARFNRTADLWMRDLGRYTPDQFLRKSSAGAWSIGQVYGHLVFGTRKMHLPNIDQCLRGQGSSGSGGKTMPGRICFLLGSFPPARITVPSSTPGYTPEQPTSQEEIRTSLAALVEEMRAVADRIAASGPGAKTKHPRLGMLSAAEWYQLIEMHFRHHLRQKRRLESELGIGG